MTRHAGKLTCSAVVPVYVALQWRGDPFSVNGLHHFMFMPERAADGGCEIPARPGVIGCVARWRLRTGNSPSSGDTREGAWSLTTTFRTGWRLIRNWGRPSGGREHE